MPWTLDGRAVEVSGWQATAKAISLDINARKTGASDDVSYLRDNYQEVAGDLRQLSFADGSFTIVPTSGSDASVTVDPPADLKPELAGGTYYVSGYSESPQQRAALQYSISLDLAREAPREPEDETDVLTETAASDEFAFEFAHGTIAPAVQNVAEKGQSQISLTMGPLSLPQVEVILESPTYIKAVDQRKVSHGPNRWQDYADRRNTVYVDSPIDHHLPSQNYVVADWSVQNITPTKYRASLTLAALPGLWVPDGRIYTVADGDTETYTTADIDGTLDINGTLIITE